MNSQWLHGPEWLKEGKCPSQSLVKSRSKPKIFYDSIKQRRNSYYRLRKIQYNYSRLVRALAYGLIDL